ncbi:MAG: FAD-binding oxidoreductase [Anaerolineae bacterium]|jgi:hypothetical protein
MAPEAPRSAGALPPVDRLRSAFRGRVIAPGDPKYDEARKVFSPSVDRRPALIVRVADEDDVARTIALAREAGLELAVRCGGHSYAGHSATEGGIVLDLRDLRGLEINPQDRTAWAQTGLTTGEYTVAAGAHGLATSFGDTGSVGIGGLTLGGGLGYLVRKHGLTIDSLLAADVVTADGRLLRVDDQNHPDLFWAIRGGGGNFAVATRFQLRLHEVDPFLGGMLVLPASVETIASVAAAAEAAPEELSVIANIFRAFEMPFLPAEWTGRFIVMVLIAYAGPVAEGLRAVAPIREVATPIADMVRPMKYPEIYSYTEGGAPPGQETSRSTFVDDLGMRTAETIMEFLESATAPGTAAQLRVFGGAMARVPADATAFAHRQKRGVAGIAAFYEDPEEAPVHEAWADRFVSVLQGEGPAAYVNFLADEGPAGVRRAYPEPTWSRLAAIKARYDPTNLFRLNQNIPPHGEESAR